MYHCHNQSTYDKSGIITKDTFEKKTLINGKPRKYIIGRFPISILPSNNFMRARVVALKHKSHLKHKTYANN